MSSSFFLDEETRQKSIAVLLMVYPSFVSGVDLLQGLKVLFDQAHPSFEKFRETRPRLLLPLTVTDICEILML